MYSNDIEPKCVLCLFGEPIPNTMDIMCEKYGVVAYNHGCRKFKYDIFKKKVHRRAAAESGYSAEDFSID